MARRKGITPAGLDLGTTFSKIATLGADGKPKAIANREGEYVTPSCVVPLKDEILVGREAKHTASLYPKFCGEGFKLMIHDPNPFITGQDSKPYTAVELSALLIVKLSRDTGERLGQKVSHAVFTVPADFNDGQRRATVDAASKAGVKVLGLLNEPTAAAIAYGFDKGKDQTVMVYDLGGGTFDVSILAIQGGRFEVLATAGIERLGGSDFDDEIMKFTLSKFKADHGFEPDPSKEPGFFQELRERAERAKMSLSVRQKTAISTNLEDKAVSLEISRKDFEGMIGKYLDQTIEKCEEALKAAGLKWKDLDALLLVGGSTRIPLVAQKLEKASGMKPKRDIEPDLAVAMGAAIEAGVKIAESGEKLVAGGKVLPPPPVKKTDVTGRPLGCLAINSRTGLEQSYVIIPSNTPLPAQMFQKFGLQEDDQEEAKIVIVQGEEGKPPEECAKVGEILLKGLPSRPSGQDSIKVTYYIDESGIVHAEALDLVSGKKVDIELDYKKGLKSS